MSSLIYTESRKFAGFPTLPVLFPSSVIFKKSKTSYRRHPSSSVVSSPVRTVVLFLIVFILEIHRFGSTQAAFSNDPDASSTNERGDLELQGSSLSSDLRQAVASGRGWQRAAVQKYATTTYIYENLSFDRKKYRGTSPSNNEMTKGLELTRANKIVTYNAIIQGESSLAFSRRGTDAFNEYFDQFAREKSSPRDSADRGTSRPSVESYIFILKDSSRVVHERSTISNGLFGNTEFSSDETSLSGAGKRLDVSTHGWRASEEESLMGTAESSEGMTYKQTAATRPFEKYNRRHFGPSRLGNVEDFSEATTAVIPQPSSAVSLNTISGNSHLRAASSISTVSSSSTFSSSSAPLGTSSRVLQDESYYSSIGSVLDDDQGAKKNLAPSVKEKGNEGKEDENVRYNHDGNQRKSEVEPKDKFYSENEDRVNEDYVGTIERPDERMEGRQKELEDAEKPITATSMIVGSTNFDQRLLFTSISKLPNSEAKPDLAVIVGPQAGENTGDAATIVSGFELANKSEVTILGLFELSQATEPRPEGPSELQAARLAVDRINEMGVLRNIRLRLIHNDTRCDPGVAVDRFFHALYTSNNSAIMPLLLGTACSEVTETLARIVPYWNIVQVSYGSTAPALSDSTEFPLFVRTVAPDSSHNPARISLIKYFGWDTVTALSQNGDMYSLAVNDLVTELEQANITCTATITFGENDYKEQLRTLKELDTRIIIGSFSPSLAPRLFCEAWKLGMHGGDYAWILPGETIDLSGMSADWWNSGPEDCLPSQLSETLDGLIIVQSYGTSLTEEPSYSGLTTSEFTSELAKRGVTLSRYAGQTYDAVWSMALALQKFETFYNKKNASILQYSHSRKDMARYLLEQLKSLNFLGVSGPVSFDGADRVGMTAFYQMHGHAIRRIALYTPNNGQLTMNCPGCARIRWPGEHPPVARRVFRFRMVTIEYGAFLAVACLASIGGTLALSFLAFNLHFRKHKSIKLSSPRLNNMAAVGCALVYGAVILLGLDHATLSDSNGYFPTICTARAYLLSAGFSLAFGSMFTKTYRVHRIFTRSRSGVVKNKLLQDTQLISLICVLLLIDCLVVTLWVTLDPMQRDLRNLTLEISPKDRAVIYQPQVEVCRSQYMNGWLAALYAYKGLLLIVGVYMAWETRHVKIPALNDSQYIGMSVYSVVITSGIVVVLANLMSDRATLAFVTITALILASTTATLALLFLPQLANILAGERADPVVQSLGLKIECNTRRFVNDDSRELQYRVEVQNRVYRREMAQLELELARLEKQLGQEPVEPSHDSSSTSIPPRNPSIGGGLPLLLLSVLPPVIPRASWPSADPSGMRRGTVAFSSQPDLEPGGARASLADIYKLQWRRDTEGPNRLGVLQRLFNLFGSRPTSRKTSTASFTGVASALRVHMGYIAGIVPGTKASSSCQVNVQGIRQPHPRCGSGPIISITSEEDRRLSLGLRRKESSEPRVNFSLPSKTNASQVSSREKIRGSPRFPHRIVPANSLSALAPGSMSVARQKWHSMEETPSRQNKVVNNRGFSYGRNDDVWTTSEVGMPLSEFLSTSSSRGHPTPDDNPAGIAIQTEANVSPEDTSWGVDLQKLFRENSTISCALENDSSDENARQFFTPSLLFSPTNLATSTTSRTELAMARKIDALVERESRIFRLENRSNDASDQSSSSTSRIWEISEKSENNVDELADELSPELSADKLANRCSDSCEN